MRKTILGLSIACVFIPCLTGCGSLIITTRDHRSAIFSKIDELSRDGNSVSVAVLCEAHTSLSFEHIVILGYDGKTWPGSLCVEAQGKVEQELLALFGRTHGFRLVDRTLMGDVLAEQKLAVSGLVSSATRLRLGHLAEASHLLIVEDNIHGKPGLLDDTIDGMFGTRRKFPKVTRTQRLIEAESGTVLATEQRDL